MPYRRLPNTDQARVRALKAVVAKADTCNMYEMAVTLKTLSLVRNFVRKFEAAQIYYTECYDRQCKAGKKHLSQVKNARLYISHFIQVLNLAAIRSEVKPAHKVYYGLDVKNHSLPDLSSEAALADWGARIIEGEKKRMDLGGIPIYNPTIAKVKVHYDIFMDSYERQKSYQSVTARSLKELSSMRAEADALILDCWNQIEKKFEGIVPNQRRLDSCREYGVVYYYRTGELKEAEK